VPSKLFFEKRNGEIGYIHDVQPRLSSRSTSGPRYLPIRHYGSHRIAYSQPRHHPVLLLADRAGAVVTREEIAERLWGKGVQLDTENAINTAIRKIRLAFGDDPAQPRYVQTVTGKGYRFIAGIADSAPPTVVTPEEPEGRVARSESRGRRRRVVFVTVSAACLLALGSRYHFHALECDPATSVQLRTDHQRRPSQNRTPPYGRTAFVFHGRIAEPSVLDAGICFRRGRYGANESTGNAATHGYCPKSVTEIWAIRERRGLPFSSSQPSAANGRADQFSRAHGQPKWKETLRHR
jgi:DNA-binding winged helix-turn-helix (wHTH) protein